MLRECGYGCHLKLFPGVDEVSTKGGVGVCRARGVRPLAHAVDFFAANDRMGDLPSFLQRCTWAYRPLIVTSDTVVHLTVRLIVWWVVFGWWPPVVPVGWVILGNIAVVSRCAFQCEITWTAMTPSRRSVVLLLIRRCWSQQVDAAVGQR